MLTLSEIFIYPIKSLGGMALEQAIVQQRGLQYDRRWMLVDEQGMFVSQREIPSMALLGTAISENSLRVFVKNTPDTAIEIPLEGFCLQKTRVTVWADKCSAYEYPAVINSWFSMQLGAPLRLVFMPDTVRRAADGRYAPRGQYVSFADGFPFLVIGQASLDDLNRRLDEPVPMDRFRPNFVVTGGTPYEEDQWSEFQIGNVLFRGVKPCGRCAITTIDQAKGEKGKEPLQTLSSFRSKSNKVLFGQNAIWLGEGEARVHVGATLNLLNKM